MQDRRNFIVHQPSNESIQDKSVSNVHGQMVMQGPDNQNASDQQKQ